MFSGQKVYILKWSIFVVSVLLFSVFIFLLFFLTVFSSFLFPFFFFKFPLSRLVSSLHFSSLLFSSPHYDTSSRGRMTRLVSPSRIDSFILGDGDTTRGAGEHALLTLQEPHKLQSPTASRSETCEACRSNHVRSPPKENKSGTLFKEDFGVHFKREPLTFKTPSTDNHFVLAACLVWSTDKSSMGLD